MIPTSKSGINDKRRRSLISSDRGRDALRHLTGEVSLLYITNIKQHNNKTMGISDFAKRFLSLLNLRLNSLTDCLCIDTLSWLYFGLNLGYLIVLMTEHV